MISTYGPGRRNCRFDVVEIATLDEWPHALFPAHLLLCVDARPVPSDALVELARRLIRGGLGVVLCHGPDCDRVHDVFARGAAELEQEGALDRDPDAEVIASSHEDEPFADTLFAFALFAPHAAYPMPSVRTVVIVAQPDRARDTHRWLPVFCARR
jgi:hypothetical protein